MGYYRNYNRYYMKKYEANTVGSQLGIGASFLLLSAYFIPWLLDMETFLSFKDTIKYFFILMFGLVLFADLLLKPVKKYAPDLYGTIKAFAVVLHILGELSVCLTMIIPFVGLVYTLFF